MLGISVTVDGIETLSRTFNRLDRIDDWRSIWPAVITEFHRIEGEQFASEGAAGGERWTPLKAVHKEFRHILQDSGALHDSLTNSEAFGAIVRPERNDLTLGTSVPYGIFHQRGTRNMPARKPINPSEQQKRRIQKAVQAGLVRFVREATH